MSSSGIAIAGKGTGPGNPGARLDSLPLEVFQVIVQDLMDVHICEFSDHLKDLAALCCTNKHIAAMASPELYHEICLPHEDDRGLGNILKLCGLENGSFVRALDIHMNSLELGDDDVGLLSCLVNLERLYIDTDCRTAQRTGCAKQHLRGLQRLLCTAASSLKQLTMQACCKQSLVDLVGVGTEVVEPFPCLELLEYLHLAMSAGKACSANRDERPVRRLLEACRQVTTFSLWLNDNDFTTPAALNLFFPNLTTWNTTGLMCPADADADFLVRHEATLKKRSMDSCHLTGNKADFFTRLMASNLRLESFFWRDSSIMTHEQQLLRQPMDDSSAVAKYFSLCQLREYEYSLSDMTLSEPDANVQLEQIIKHGLRPCLRKAVIGIPPRFRVDWDMLRTHLARHFPQAEVCFHCFEPKEDSSDEGSSISWGGSSFDSLDDPHSNPDDDD